MRIIINIPEEAYKLLQNEGVDWLGAEHILNAVANGKPLKTGYWLPYAEIDGKTVEWVCSSCRRMKSTTKDKTEYCPVCGAYMRGGKEHE